jgi:tight adherence protein B
VTDQGVESDAAAEAALAAALQRVAVLIGAGLAPRTAWAHVGEAADDPTIVAVARRVAAGAPIAAAVAELTTAAAWRSTGAAWSIAEASGAPLAPALRAFADGLRDREAARRDIRIALAGPRSTASIVLLLPAVALLLALLMGVDLIGALVTPFGAASLIGGGLLVLLARRWTRILLRAAEPPAPTTGLALDLLGVAAGGGGPPERAAELVAAALRTAHPEIADAGALEADLEGIRALAAFSRRTGAPLGELARTEAAEQRARVRAVARETAETLGVRLMLPLGACILPAFLLIGVVPMLIGLLSSTTAAP